MLGEGEAEHVSPVSPRLDEEQQGADAPDPSQEIIAVSAPSYRRNIALKHGQGNDIAGIDGTSQSPSPETALFRAEWDLDIEERAAIEEESKAASRRSCRSHSRPFRSLVRQAIQSKASVAAGRGREKGFSTDMDTRLPLLGWLAADLFSADGFASISKGAAVVNLTATAATLSDRAALEVERWAFMRLILVASLP